MTYLQLAYLATWGIHIGYLLWITRKAARVRRELADLRAQAKPGARSSSPDSPGPA